MLWWNHLTLAKKILFGGSFLCLAAGLTTYDTGIIGGVFLFILFFVLGVLIPSRKAKTPEEKAWVNVTSPHLPKKEKLLHTFLNFITIFLALVDINYLFNSLLNDNYILIGICTIILVLIFHSWLKMNPRYYNEIYLTSKIIPINKSESTRELFSKVCDIITPFGKPLMGFVPDFKEEVGIYRIVDLFWIVYFYIDNNEIHIEAERINNEEISPKETQLIYSFIQELTELFCYLVNTGELPDINEVHRIFKNLESK